MVQEFFINKNSTLPYLALELIDDGRYDYDNFYSYIQNSSIYFTMVDVDTAIVKVAHKPATVFLKENTGGCKEEYLVGYVWEPRDVDRVGTYRGQFEINMNGDLEGEPNGTLIVPIADELLIYVKDGIIKK